MSKKLNFVLKSKRSQVQILAGLLMITAALMLGWQSLAQAYGDTGNPDTDRFSSSVQFGVSDLDLFGKRLSMTPHLPLQSLSVNQLKPGSGPVVPVRLRIPALNIDTSVEQVGMRNNVMDVPSNVWDAGWLNSNPRPGDTGNAVLDGHKDTVKGGAIFWSLPNLKPGDKVYVSDINGYELAFEVTEVASYPLDQAPLERIFGASSEKHLNLISCDGTFVHSEHTYDRRVVVYTRLLEHN
ncbi:MAG TPA: class F sortase [Chloroflexia bacterium]|nr:class F sortase [Chloroflexia bacterium]